MIAVIILAAGSSRRLGRLKQLERIGSETLLARAVHTAEDAQLGPTLVVVDALNAEVRLEAKRLPCTVVLNADAAEGMASSLRAGLRAAAPETSAVIVMTCDQPAVSATHLRTLASGELEVLASEYAGRRGVPAYFPSSTFATLIRLSGDAGARKLLQSAKTIELEHGDLDVDTGEELERARILFGGRQV